MNHYTCHTCQTAIPAGLAVLRSVSFRRVAFHRECWTAERPALRMPVQQRRAMREIVAR